MSRRVADTFNARFGAWTLNSAIASGAVFATHRRRWDRHHDHPRRTFLYTMPLPPWVVADLVRTAHTQYARRCAGAVFTALAQLSPERRALLLDVFRSADDHSQQAHDVAWHTLHVMLREARLGPA